MELKDLGRLDLNLLVALEALLEEGSVSNAARRLFITQSAMSKTLGRLRELFDDPLFIRKGAGMVPTPRAQQLAGHLPEVLQAVTAMIAPVSFDPLHYDGEFRLMVQGHLGVWLLPLLLERLRDTAPNLRLHTISTALHPDDQLASGELDFVLHAEHKHYGNDIRLMTLGYAEPVLLARRGHPLEGLEPDWETLAGYPQVRLIIPEFDEILFEGRAGERGEPELVRREVDIIPHLLTDHLFTAIRVVLTSDYLFPAPPLFMEQEEIVRELISLPLPEGEEVNIKYVLAHHKRIEHSPAHTFFKGEMLAVIDAFRARNDLPGLGELRAQRGLAY